MVTEYVKLIPKTCVYVLLSERDRYIIMMQFGRDTDILFMKQDYRVIGGSQAKIGSYPWQAMIVRREGATESFHCGGSIIDARWILTAAHCISKTV